MKNAITAVILVVASLCTPLAVQARQYRGGGGQVVHTRRAPVIFHRALPPFRGQHVYQSGR
ncbi:MAG: hypothetical protein ACR2FY_18105 [Pirellulaceae bacterium]